MSAAVGLSRERRLQHILTKDELKTINRAAIEKIESYIESKITISTRGRSTSGDRLHKLENEVCDATSKYEQCKAKMEATEAVLRELETQLTLSKSEVNRVTDSLKRAESEAEDMKQQRNQAVDERDRMQNVTERKDRELERLKGDLATLTSQLEKAINDKCEALARTNEIQNKEFALNFKEQHMDQERSLLKTQVKGLSDELAKSNDELQTIRFNLSQKILDLETQIQEKNDEMKIHKDTNENLNEVNRALQNKNESLTEKLLGHRDFEDAIVQNYKKEVESKSKLAELYKGMQEDTEAKSVELSNGITELQKMLSESIDKYGELETNFKQLQVDHKEILEKKNYVISALKNELENANELLQGAKDSCISRVLEKMSPLAAVAGRILHSNMSVTQLYTHLNNVSDELSKEKEENRRSFEALSNLQADIRDRAPVLEELKSKYEQVLENNASITHQLDVIMRDNNSMRVDYNEATRISTHFQKENEKLKRELADLGRQVCYLLKEMQITKGVPNVDSDPSVSSHSMNASKIISKHLVTFSDIQELQANNQKLLRIIRDLSEKQEEREKQKVELEVKGMQEKCETLQIKVCELVEELKQQTQMMDNVIKQRDMYRQQCMVGKVITCLDDSGAGEDPNVTTASPTDGAIVGCGEDVESWKTKFIARNSQLEKKIEEYNVYKEESTTNHKMLVQQIEDMRKEINQVTSAYSKTAAQLEFLNEKQNTLQLNIGTYKKQIGCLEERNHNYNVVIGKHEQTIKYLRNETMANQSKLSKAEVQVQTLQREVAHLKNVEARLSTERNLLVKEKQGQAVLMTNLELIKASLERSEAENSLQLESQLDNANAEVIALRRSLQDEQEKFRDLASHLEKETNHAKTRMEEEKNQAGKLKEQLASMREELKNKSDYIGEISEKFSSAINPARSDGTFDSVKKVRELENLLHTKQIELTSLEQHLEESKQRIKQYCDISEETQQQLKTLNNQMEELKKSSEIKITTLEESESRLKEKCSELETELSLQSDGARASVTGPKSDLAKIIERLKTVQNELKEKNSLLDQARMEIITLSENMRQAEEKYAHEMILHSTDIQTLSQAKEKLSALQQNITELQNAKDQAVQTLTQSKESWEKQEQSLVTEKEELLSRFADMNNQNSLLLDQVQALSTKLSLATVSKQTGESANTSLVGDTSLNQSLNEDEVKSSEKLVQIIKFFRKERDIIMAKFDILQTENVRVKSEFDAAEKKLDEAKIALAMERERLEVNSISLIKNAEIVRKVETLDAITDSNRILRVERDNLLLKVTVLTETVSKLEETLIPLQERSKENSLKLEFLQNDNTTLKGEVIRWRTRVNSLVERANKTSPEDWKRLQNERETLAKMLTSEKENVKRLNEEVSSIRAERAKFEELVSNLNRQHNSQVEEIKKQNDELVTLKKDLAKISQELAETKSSLNEKVNDSDKLNENIKEKDALLSDIRNKEMQIRKIAKKYKAQYEELTTKREQEATETALSVESHIEARRELENKNAEMESRIAAAVEENNTLKNETESLKVAMSDKEEKARLVLKQAKAKILQLTESNENLTKQLSAVKECMETAEQNKEENDTRFELLTSQYEARLNRAEKDKNESVQEIQRLNKDIETLNQKVSQLQRQLSGPEATSATVAPTPTPTANIKPMAAHSAGPHPQQAPRRGETPFASIRPMASTATRTAAVLPSPSSSGHSSTEYMPASSSARPRPPAADSPPHPPQALVLPRVEEGPGTQPTPPSHSSQGAPSRPSLKRKPQDSHKSGQQMKRSKVQQGQVTESHCETEYQVPTSSQRDHDDDGVVLDSEDEPDDEQHYQDNYQEQMYEDDEEVEADDDVMEEEVVEGGDVMDSEVAAGVEGREGRSAEAEEGEATALGMSRREEAGERQLGEDGSQELPAQSECEVGGSSEVLVSPQSHPPAALPPPTSSTAATSPLHTHTETQHTNTVSSGSQGDNSLVVERVSTVQGVYEEGGDDGIVPSTPTLYVPRRTDGFGEAVSSPVGTGRFTFTSSGGGAIEDTHADLTSQLSEGGVSGSGESGISTVAASSEGSSSAVVGEGEEGREAEASTGEAVAQRRTNAQQQLSQQQHRPVPIVWSPHQGPVRGQHHHHRGHLGNNRARRPNRRQFMRY